MDIVDLPTSGRWRALFVHKLHAVPVPLYGGALALLGLSLLVPFTWPWTQPLVSLALVRWAGILALLGALAVHGTKAWLTPAAFHQDMDHVGTSPFFGQIGVALALLSESLHGSRPDLADAALLGSAILAVLCLANAARLILLRRPSWRDASPAWLLPPIQCLYLGLLAGDKFDTGGTLALTVGGLTALAASVCLIARLWRGPSLPAPARPALTTFVAIPSVLLLAVLQQADPHRAVLYLAAAATLLGFVAALMSLPLALGQRFKVSWWAYGMPLSAAALAFNALASHRGANPWLLAAAQTASWCCVLITAALSLLSLAAIHRFFFQSSSRP